MNKGFRGAAIIGHHSGKDHGHSVSFGAGNPENSRNSSNPGNIENPVPLNGGLSGGSRPSRRVYDAPSKGILCGWEVAGYILTKALAAGILGMPLLLNQLGLVSLSSEMLWITSLVSLIFLAATGVSVSYTHLTLPTICSV